MKLNTLVEFYINFWNMTNLSVLFNIKSDKIFQILSKTQ